MSIISKLKAVLTLDKSQYEKGLKGAEKDTQSFGKTLGKLGAVIGAAFGAQQVIKFGAEMARLSTVSANVTNAFNQLGISIKSLRLATNFGVAELRLKQMAVQAVNLGVSADKLATYFKFATIRAAETGESVEYLVNSIVIGIGRQSRLVLDNLGIGLAELNEEIKKTGNFSTAANNIIIRNLENSGVAIEDSVDAVTQLNTAWEDFQDNLAHKIGPGISQTIRLVTTALTGDFSNVVRNMPVDQIQRELRRVATDWLGDPVMRSELSGGVKKYVALLDAEMKRREADFAKIGQRMWGIISGSIVIDQKAGDKWKMELFDETLGSIGKLQEEIDKLELRVPFALAGVELDKLKIKIQLLKNEMADLTKMPTFGEAGLGAEPVTMMQPQSITDGLDLNADAFENATLRENEYNAAIQELSPSMITLGQIMNDVVSMGIDAFSNAILNFIDNGDILQAFSGFLSQFGSMLIKYGASLIAFGVGLKVMMTSGDPYSKIAAGAVMIAAGAAMSLGGKAIAKHHGGGGGGGYTGSYGGGTYGGGGTYDYNREIVMVARGDDLVGVINRRNYAYGEGG